MTEYNVFSVQNWAEDTRNKKLGASTFLPALAIDKMYGRLYMTSKFSSWNAPYKIISAKAFTGNFQVITKLRKLSWILQDIVLVSTEQ
jgi:hypothetical protein